MISQGACISLWDTAFGANTERFQGLVPLLPHLCPLSVPKGGGGGMWGILTTDGLWAMPLNTRWVPVKARRLQDREKLKKYVPSHKQGDVCPNGVPAPVERRNDDNDRSQNNE